eukprot:TRINITY_DN202_c0_g1_i1.p1 TRINITY_DN202_c0_g1~~TRINITY_DN202_c0_g1_i1.p1  ORF type:complete len:1398 (-),score=312.11 TRINITY_DN202_c0_g1_i1:397-4590(-)
MPRRFCPSCGAKMQTLHQTTENPAEKPPQTVSPSPSQIKRPPPPLQRPPPPPEKSPPTVKSPTPMKSPSPPTQVPLPDTAVPAPAIEFSQKGGHPATPLKPKPELKHTTSRSTLIRKPSPKDNTNYIRNREGLVDCFFIVTNNNLVAELQERIEQGEKMLDDVFWVKFSASVVFQYPLLHPDDFSPLIWMFCFPQRLSLVKNTPPEPRVFPFVLTALDGTKKFVTCLMFFKLLPESVTQSLLAATSTEQDKPATCSIFTPVCYCLYSRFPCFSFFREWLTMAYDRVVLHPQNVPLESYVATLVNAVPAPVAGGMPLCIRCDGMRTPEMTISLPGENDLPLLDLPMNLLFRVLNIEQVLTLFYCLLLEEKVLISCSQFGVLHTVCECLAQLLFPLRWVHVFITLLPESLGEFLHSPMPFLIGMPAACTNFYRCSGVLEELVYVDLDSSTVTLPTNVPDESAGSSATLQQYSSDVIKLIQSGSLPQPESTTLNQDLKLLLQRDVMLYDNVDFCCNHLCCVPPQNVDLQIRLAFCNFMLSLLKDVDLYLLHVRVFDTPYTTFDKITFTQSRPDCSKFMELLVETQAFTLFVESQQEASPDSNSLVSDFIAFATFHGKPAASTLPAATPSTAVPFPASFGLSRPKISKRKWRRVPLPSLVEQFERFHFQRREQTPPAVINITPRLNTANTGATISLSTHINKELLPTPRVFPVPKQSPVVSKFLPLDLAEEPEEAVEEAVDTIQAAARQAAHAILANSADNDFVDFLDKLQHKHYREMLGQALLDLKHLTMPQGQLSTEQLAQLALLVNTALKAASVQKDYDTPVIFLEVSCTYFHIREGAEEFLYTRIRNVDLWQCVAFWDQCFLRHNHVQLLKHYKDICEVSRSWDGKPAEEKQKITQQEMELILNTLNQLVFQMTNVGVSGSVMFRFVARTCKLTALDAERTKIAKTVAQNLTKLETGKDSPAEEADVGVAVKLHMTPRNALLAQPSAPDGTGVEWARTLNSMQADSAKPWMQSPKLRKRSSGFPSSSSLKPLADKDLFVVTELQGHTQPVLCVSNTPSLVVSGSCDHSLRIWDVHSGRHLGTLSGHTEWVNCCQVDEANHRTVSGSYDKTLALWDLLKFQRIRTLTGHKSQISCLQLKGQLIVSGSHDANVNIWDTRTKKSVVNLAGHTGSVTCLLCPENDTVISGSRDNTVRVWNLKTGTEQLQMKGHLDWVKCLALDAASQRLLSGGLDGTVRVWDLSAPGGITTPQEPLHVYECHEGAVNDLIYDAVADLAYSAGADATLKVWSPHLHQVSQLEQEQQEEERLVLQGHAGEVSLLSFFRQGSLISGGADGNLVVWRKPTLPFKPPTAATPALGYQCQVLVGHTNHITAMQTLENRVVSCGWDNTVRVWELSADL